MLEHAKSFLVAVAAVLVAQYLAKNVTAVRRLVS